MNPTFKRLTPLLGLLVLLAGCGKTANPVTPTVIPPLLSLTLAVHADTLNVGETSQFVVAAVATDGAAYRGLLVWASSDPGVFVVNSIGRVTAIGEGSARLTVSGGGRADSATVLVYPTAAGWLVQTSHASEDLYGVFFDGAGRLGWAVGGGGVVLSTADAGATWTRRTPTSVTLRGVWFTSAQEGWAVGHAGTVLHTLNAGSTWTQITSAASSENLSAVYFATRDTGWAVGAGGLILSTTDRGETWRRTLHGGVTLNGVMFAGTQDGWAVGDNGIVLGTHDRGLSWFTVPYATSLALRGLWRHDEATAVAVGAGGVVLRTSVTPDSVAWAVENAGSLNQLEGVCLADELTGFAVGSNGAGAVLRTTDGGATWAPQIANSGDRLRGVFFLDARRGWAVGDNGTIRHTASGGE